MVLNTATETEQQFIVSQKLNHSTVGTIYASCFWCKGTI